MQIGERHRSPAAMPTLVQLTLSQDFRVSAAVLVTTPQRLSFVDVVKGVEMFDKVGIPTVAVVENMSGLRLPQLEAQVPVPSHTARPAAEDLGRLPSRATRRLARRLTYLASAAQAEELISKHGLSDAVAVELREMVRAEQPLFGKSHVTRLKEMWGIRSSFSLPLLPDVAASADGGVPLVVSAPTSEAAALYADLAAAVDMEVSALATRVLPRVLYSSEEQQVLIALPNGTTQSIRPHELRRLCRSPSNDPTNLPADLAMLDAVPMGNYAISVRWSDGHQSLLPYASFIEGYA